MMNNTERRLIVRPVGILQNRISSIMWFEEWGSPSCVLSISKNDFRFREGVLLAVFPLVVLSAVFPCYSSYYFPFPTFLEVKECHQISLMQASCGSKSGYSIL